MKRVLKSAIRPLYKALVRLPAAPRFIVRAAARMSTEMNAFADFVEGGFGEEYGVTKRDRARLVRSFDRNCQRIQSANGVGLHVVLARELLSIPRHVPGDVIECGAFKGASTASLSLLCRIVGRRLLVCDSFEGLPDTGEMARAAAQSGNGRHYEKGMFCGSLEEVQENVRRYGDIGVCEFIPGFFSESLQAIAGPLVFAFLDVNLVDSMKDCLRYIWPLMAEDSMIYSDDVVNMDIVRLCFDDRWWQEVLHEPAPGLVGSGCGLPLGPDCCALGYICKSRQSDARWGNGASWPHGLGGVR